MGYIRIAKCTQNFFAMIQAGRVGLAILVALFLAPEQVIADCDNVDHIVRANFSGRMDFNGTDRRFANVGTWGKRGIMFKGEYGKDVLAPADGLVYATDARALNRDSLIIDVGNTYFVRLDFLSEVNLNVPQSGALPVQRGQKVGFTAETRNFGQAVFLQTGIYHGFTEDKKIDYLDPQTLGDNGCIQPYKGPVPNTVQNPVYWKEVHDLLRGNLNPGAQMPDDEKRNMERFFKYPWFSNVRAVGAMVQNGPFKEGTYSKFYNTVSQMVTRSHNEPFPVQITLPIKP